MLLKPKNKSIPMAMDAEKEMLLEQVQELKRSNERLERAFLAISALLESKFSDSAPGKPRNGPDEDALSLEFKRKLKRNRGALIKEKILEQVDLKGDILLSDLKFIIVDQLKYTSKPSFYRYMKELEKDEKLIRSEAAGNVFVTVGREMLIKNNR